jgi:hypothetical protein
MKLRAALFLFCAAVGCSGSNLLVNPGFETGAFTGWTIGGTSTSSPGELRQHSRYKFPSFLRIIFNWGE